MDNLDLAIKIISVVAIVWSFLSAFLIVRYKQKLDLKAEKLKDLEKLINSKKTELYGEIFDTFFGILKVEKINKKHNTQALGQKIINVKRDALIYAPGHIVKQIVLWQEANHGNTMKGFQEYMKLLHLIREDLGHKEPLTDDEILGSFMNDPEEKARFKIQMTINAAK